MSFLTRFINSSEVNEHILNQDYRIQPKLISDLYQPQTSISNTYVLTFSDEVVKALNKFIENESNPIFKEAVNHAHASELTTDDNEDKQEYEKFIEFKNLRESLTTKNYQHYYIHLDDSLDKLIGRTEANFELKEETRQLFHQNEKKENKLRQKQLIKLIFKMHLKLSKTFHSSIELKRY